MLSWHKHAGERVNRDETLVDLETDKVVLEVPAPAAGILKEVHVQDGETVRADTVLAIIDEQVRQALDTRASAAQSSPERRTTTLPRSTRPH